jgi:hypothetical protein
MRMQRLLLIGLAAGAVLLTAVPAAAAVTAKDLQIIGRALSFLEKPPRGEVRVGIVYSAANAQSVREAEDLQKLMADGLRVGTLTLRPVMVVLGDAAGANVDLFLLASGLGTEAAALGAVTARRHIACVTTDIAQVRAGTCMMGVRSQSKIEILVNRSAASRSGMAFSAVFRMMITEI